MKINKRKSYFITAIFISRAYGYGIVMQFFVILLTGIPVALLQEGGTFSNNSYLIRKDLQRQLKDFTLCARLSLNYLRGEKNYWLSIGNDTQDNLLTGGN